MVTLNARIVTTVGGGNQLIPRSWLITHREMNKQIKDNGGALFGGRLVLLRACQLLLLDQGARVGITKRRVDWAMNSTRSIVTFRLGKILRKGLTSREVMMWFLTIVQI